MRKRIGPEKNLRSAKELQRHIKFRGLEYGCLPISVRALGGVVSLRSVLTQQEQMVRISSLPQAGLEVGGFIQINGTTSGDEVEEILTILSNFRDMQTELKSFAGLLVLCTFSQSESDNHFFAILPRESMRSTLKKSLEKHRQYIVADSRGSKLVGRTHVDDFAEFANQVISLGGELLIFQVFRD